MNDTAAVSDAGSEVQGTSRPRVPRALLLVLALAIVVPVVLYVGSRPVASPVGGIRTRVQGASKGVAPRVGYTAPNFALPALDGGQLELQQFRGRPVLLNFWATWCPPCREEMPILEQLYRERREQGFVVLAVSIDEPAFVNEVGPYIQRGSPQTGAYTFPVALDTKRQVAEQYKLLGLPVSFFIDRDGIIREMQLGGMNRQLVLEKLRTILDAPQG